MKSRMKNPALSLPGMMDVIRALAKVMESGGLPRKTAELVHLRASQINGCSVCVDIHSRALVAMGEKSERLFTVAAWRDAPYFSDAERAALALTEAATRLADCGDAVSDEIWDEAARHFSEAELTSLVMSIAVINMFNRFNVVTRQIGGEWTANVM